jgi:hypothetical protein
MRIAEESCRQVKAAKRRNFGSFRGLIRIQERSFGDDHGMASSVESSVDETGRSMESRTTRRVGMTTVIEIRVPNGRLGHQTGQRKVPEMNVASTMATAELHQFCGGEINIKLISTGFYDGNRTDSRRELRCCATGAGRYPRKALIHTQVPKNTTHRHPSSTSIPVTCDNVKQYRLGMTITDIGRARRDDPTKCCRTKLLKLAVRILR